MYEHELAQLKKLMDPDLWNLLADNGCIIAGGAITSVFTNKEVNDVDVYFPSKEAFTNVMSEIYHNWEPSLGTGDYGLTAKNSLITHVTKKAVLIISENQKIQLIGYAFYKTVPEIFDAFDYTINMGACYMYDGRFTLHADFLKHNAQRYLQFNPNTTYPLISALRANKYRDRGYSISKAQLLRVLLAVNRKNIDSWEKLMDELGGMYGTAPEEIFDTKKEFSLDLAIEALDNFEIKDTIVANTPSVDIVAATMKGSFTDEFFAKRKAYFEKHPWMQSPYRPKQVALLDELEDW